jgi:CRISPR type III-A-associated protein Csm2
MPNLTPNNVVAELERRSDTLSQVLQVQDFADRGDLADRLAKSYGEDLKATQLRRLFHTIKDIERRLSREDRELTDEELTRILPLQYQLAYARGRRLIPQHFYELLRACMGGGKLKTVADFRRLTSFLEAILAYHKYYDKGGE